MKESKMVSLDNGVHYMTAAEAMPEIVERNLWDALTNYMDDDTREFVHYKLAPCTDLEFLEEYLNRAEENLILG